MGFDLYSTQESIKTYIQTQMPQFKFYRGSVPDDDAIQRVNGKLVTYFTLRYRPMQKRSRGDSFMGARSHDYYSSVDVNCVGATEGAVAEAITIVIDRLIGFTPVGGTQLTPAGGSGDFVIKNSRAQPSAYVSSQRLEFGINIATNSPFLAP